MVVLNALPEGIEVLAGHRYRVKRRPDLLVSVRRLAQLLLMRVLQRLQAHVLVFEDLFRQPHSAMLRSLFRQRIDSVRSSQKNQFASIELDQFHAHGSQSSSTWLGDRRLCTGALVSSDRVRTPPRHPGTPTDSWDRAAVLPAHGGRTGLCAWDGAPGFGAV